MAAGRRARSTPTVNNAVLEVVIGPVILSLGNLRPRVAVRGGISKKMARHTAWILAAALVCAVPASAELCDSQAPPSYPGRPQERRPDAHRPADDKRPPKWWVDEQSRAELGITDQQSAEIEQIFSSSLPRLRAERQQLDQLETTLAQTIKDSVADPSVVKRQVDKVEDLRADLNKGRTLMLYRMHRVLSAEQRQKLQAMFQRRQRERGGQGPGGR